MAGETIKCEMVEWVEPETWILTGDLRWNGNVLEREVYRRETGELKWEPIPKVES